MFSHPVFLILKVQGSKERESGLQKELERLRLHLISVEENYTQEALEQEEKINDLKNKLNLAEERMRNSSTAYSSAR